MSSVVAFVSPNFDFETRKAIGLKLIEFIRRRTKKGKGLNGKTMGGPDGDGKYSKNYVKTAEFKVAGKKKGKVNLTLTGDLLDDLIVLDTSIAGRIEIGPEQEENKNKARWMREKGYNFLALSQEEVNSVVKGFDRTQVPTVNISQGIAQSLLRSIFGN